MMRVIVDCDPGLGKKKSLVDVDDGLALFFMLNQPDLFEIEGITVTFGNTRVKTGYKLLKEYLQLTSRSNLPHYLGASSREDLGELTEASGFLISEVKDNPKELTLLTLGPLTNIATAIMNYPEFLDDLKEVIFMGGLIHPTSALSIEPTETIQYSEFNFLNDPRATKLLIEAETRTPRIGMGLDVCCQIVFNRTHYEFIKAKETAISQYIIKHILNWLNLWEKTKAKGFYPFDTLVPIYLLKSELFETSEFVLKVDTESVPGKLSIVERDQTIDSKITYCMDFSSESSKKECMNILLRGLTI
jgi:purine nucleosidase